MWRKNLALFVALILVGGFGLAQETPKPMVTGYDTLADLILSMREMEADYVRAILDGHWKAAKMAMKSGNFEASAAEMALFANEGDNAIGGVRKRLLEGGHHYNAEGEEKGIFEPGYVIVTREAKQKMLEISKAFREATTDEQRMDLWKGFEEGAKKLLSN